MRFRVTHVGVRERSTHRAQLTHYCSSCDACNPSGLAA
jgi:hypothetical protein